MLELIKELAVFERAPDEVTVSPAHFEESGFGNAPVWWAFVAEAEGIVVGFALYYIRYSTWKGQRMYLEDIIVTEQWRCRGIGRLLMEAILHEARDKNLHGVSWQVLDWNTDAIRFYKQWNPKFDGDWVNVMLTFDK
jgi:GNAT superfamily N-acetyltransferase